MIDLSGQVALVTGGAAGIGKGIALVLAKAGAKVVVADINAETGDATAKEIGGVFKQLDVTDQARVRAVVDEVVAECGQLDILASNAGIFPQATLEDMTEADWDHMQAVNVKSMFFVVQAALKAMAPRGYGRVVITSSITGPITGFPGWSHYGASKAAQLGFMRSAALEYANRGITVNAVQPGNILTEGLKAQGEAYLDQQRAIIPTHTLGTPEDIGHAVAFLASPDAAYITGQIIYVDGGLTAQLTPRDQPI